MIPSSKCRPSNSAGRCLVQVSPYQLGSRCLQQSHRERSRRDKTTHPDKTASIDPVTAVSSTLTFDRDLPLPPCSIGPDTGQDFPQPLDRYRLGEIGIHASGKAT